MDPGQDHLQPSPARAALLGWLPRKAGGRALAVGLALLIEGLLLLLFLSMTFEKRPGKETDAITVVDLDRPEVVEEAPAPISPAVQEQSAAPSPPVEEPLPPAPVQPSAAPAAPAPVPTPPLENPPLPVPSPHNPPASPTRPAPSGGAVYGPPDTGRRASRDTARVGTAPNGEPLYAAAWYREPTDEDLRGYLSTASGPGWGLIACRTVPNFRVEDCVGLDEYPQGSQINRAVLAAAWQFQVRPPSLGGVSQVGSWVRIRIDYGLRRR